MSKNYKKSLCIWLFSVLLIGKVLGQPQEEKPIYFEKLEDGKTQFYFDDHYFLVDKFCQLIHKLVSPSFINVMAKHLFHEIGFRMNIGKVGDGKKTCRQ